VGPICDSNAVVVSTTYYSCNSGAHSALDMSNQTCSEYNHRAMLQGTYDFEYYGGCGSNCANPPSSTQLSCNGGAGNYYIVRGGGGWDFRQLHTNANQNSGSKKCTGSTAGANCILGLVGSTGESYGAHVHADNRRDKTRMTAWYGNAGITCGSSASCYSYMGQVNLP